MAENAVYLIAGTILIGFVWFVIFAESAFTPIKEKNKKNDGRLKPREDLYAQ